MQILVQPGEGLERRMAVELAADEIEQAVEKRLKDMAGTARLAGFRPGKVPLSVLRQRFGGRLRQEVFGELVQSSFSRAVDQEHLKPAGAPTIEPDVDQKAKRFAYKATFEVLPTVQLADLGGYAVKRPVAEVGESDLEDMMERLRRQHQTWREVERPAEKGDQVRVTFKGAVDGEPFEGGEAEDLPVVLGAGAMLAGFEDGLVGAAAGAKRDLELRFPGDYRVAVLAGKPVLFEVEVRSVSEPVLPEVNDEFAGLFGVTEGGLEQFKQDIRNNMERELKQRIKARIKTQVIDILLQAYPIEVPKVLLDEEIESLRQQTRKNNDGKIPESMELPSHLFEKQAKRRVVLGLVMSEYVEEKAIGLDAARVRQAVEELASTYEQPQQVVDFYMTNREQLAPVESLVLEDQVVDTILEQVNVKDEPCSFKELTEPAD